MATYKKEDLRKKRKATNIKRDLINYYQLDRTNLLVASMMSDEDTKEYVMDIRVYYPRETSNGKMGWFPTKRGLRLRGQAETIFVGQFIMQHCHEISSGEKVTGGLEDTIHLVDRERRRAIERARTSQGTLSKLAEQYGVPVSPPRLSTSEPETPTPPHPENKSPASEP